MLGNSLLKYRVASSTGDNFWYSIYQYPCNKKGKNSKTANIWKASKLNCSNDLTLAKHTGLSVSRLNRTYIINMQLQSKTNSKMKSAIREKKLHMCMRKTFQ